MFDHQWARVALAAVLPPVRRLDDDGPEDEEDPVGARARALSFDRSSGVSARTEAAVHGRAGLERLSVNVRGLQPEGGTASLLVGDGVGEMIEIASALAERSGRARFRVETLRHLAGSPFRIRLDGNDVLKGTLPIL